VEEEQRHSRERKMPKNKHTFDWLCLISGALRCHKGTVLVCITDTIQEARSQLDDKASVESSGTRCAEMTVAYA